MSGQYKTVLLLLLDSVGAGALPDAAQYGDAGAATLQHVLALQPQIPHLRRLGLCNIEGLTDFGTDPAPTGVYGRCASVSRGKDSIVGHWEIMGVPTQRPFEVYPDGFPQEILDEFCARTGAQGVLGNCAASGTEIIARLGEEHQRTGWPIVYTSADSVFQIACHEETVPVPELYRWCEQARQMFDARGIGMGRVIARPFIGEPGAYTRTARRHDYAAVPPQKTFLEVLVEQGVPTLSIGKPYDLFAARGFSRGQEKTADNSDGMEKTLAALRRGETGLLFTNLVDFDMRWGHRRDAASYAAGLEEVDTWLPQAMDALGDDGLLLITADHGCDPTHTGTDHTREYIPLLAWSRRLAPGPCGTRPTFADVGATALRALGVTAPSAEPVELRDRI